MVGGARREARLEMEVGLAQARRGGGGLTQALGGGGLARGARRWRGDLCGGAP